MNRQLEHQDPKTSLQAIIHNFKGNDIFICVASGNSMIKAGISDGALLIANNKKKPASNDIVVVNYENTNLVKRFKIIDNEKWLCSENEEYPNYPITDNTQIEFIGVVINSISQH